MIITWQTIGGCPKDGSSFDVWAQGWDAPTGEFVYKRFPNCSYDTGSASVLMGNGLAFTNWRPLYWAVIPTPTNISETK